MPWSALVYLAAVWSATPALTLRSVDADWKPPVRTPTFAAGQGPLVLIDAGHQNLHTADGLYAPFAELLRRDGYRVASVNGSFTLATLEPAQILVIANSLHPSNAESWKLPTPSAFTPEEIHLVNTWVAEGGSLWLIADHMPFAGAAADLAASFGMRLANGYAFGGTEASPTIDRFSRLEGTLKEHPITRGRAPAEYIDQVATFCGSAFRIDATAPAEPLLVFGPEATCVLPDDSQQFLPSLPRHPIPRWCQGATLRHGRGRVAVFSEAAMFSAQRQGLMKRRMGMNHPQAQQNARFVLNTAHWLSGLLDP